MSSGIAETSGTGNRLIGPSSRGESAMTDYVAGPAPATMKRTL
jgi:hypothetical protein